MPEYQGNRDADKLRALYDYKAKEAMMNISKQNEEKIELFKKRISQFQNIKTLQEAKILSEKILPVAKEVNKFNVGNAVCTIVNKPNLFRISLNSDSEFISYNFVS